MIQRNYMTIARRYNKGKLRYELLPVNALRDVVEVYTKGAEKYTIRDEQGKVVEDGANNWRSGLSWMDMLASIERHIESFKAGEDIDPDLGTKHLANAAWGLLGILEYYRIFPEGDDRRHDYLYPKKIGLDIDGVLADFTGHLLKKLGVPNHVPLHWNDPIIRRGFEDYKKDKQFWLDIPPLVTREDINFEPHCYITARSIGEDITKEWLDKYHLPTAKIYSIGIGESKVEIAKESGVDIFIDDNFDNFVQLTNAGIFTYLYNAPYNEKYDVGFRRIHHLNEINI